MYMSLILTFFYILIIAITYAKQLSRVTSIAELYSDFKGTMCMCFILKTKQC